MTESAPILTEQTEPTTAAPTARDEALQQPAPTTTAETPAKKSATVPNEMLATAHETKISRQDTPLSVAGKAGAGGGQGAGVAVMPSLGAKATPVINTKAGESLVGIASTAPPATAKMEQDSLTALTMPELKSLPQLTAASEKAKDEPAVAEGQAAPSADKLEVEKRAEAVNAEESRVFDDARTRSTQRFSRQPAASGRVGISTLQKSAMSSSAGTGFAETLQRAQQTTDLKKREKIWRDFLKSDPDSSYRALAISHLAQTLAAASDSTTKLEQLEKNLTYFQDHAATLRPLMGAPQFERELGRLQMLVNRRKASSKP
jgi:hypothetical protein